jgi:hypothetical protein
MVSRIFIFHGSWSVRQTISSWVMERATDCLSMGHGAYARLILHGSWGVRQADSPWVMECTMVSRIFIFHGSWSVRQTISSWVMERATD